MNDGLCAPGTPEFVDWRERIEAYAGPFCNEVDRAALESLFETAGGSGWTNTDGWLEGPALAGWHGVRADSLGHVTALHLSHNGLTGQLPGNLEALAYLTELKLDGNTDLSGRLPLSLTRLSLRELNYANTGLCAPADEAFRSWLSTIPLHEGTGVECDVLPDREILKAVYAATGGSEWTNRENWLTEAPLGDWHGVRVDGHGAVVELSLGINNLRGSIPPELGDFANLEYLDLSSNELSGPIPPELGNLVNLSRLYLSHSDLSGPIPTELGNLAKLKNLVLWNNNLTGPIPPELGNLVNLSRLYLSHNELSGPIPPELGNLVNLSRLYLSHNELSGPIPPEFGGLSELVAFVVRGNAGMSGSLPTGLANLQSLETFHTGGTMLCAPSDEAFLEWLYAILSQRVALCHGEPIVAYLVQAVQSREF